MPSPLPEHVVIDRALGRDDHPEIVPGPPIPKIQITITGLVCEIREAVRPSFRVGDTEAHALGDGGGGLQGLLDVMPDPGDAIVATCWLGRVEAALKVSDCERRD